MQCRTNGPLIKFMTRRQKTFSEKFQIFQNFGCIKAHTLFRQSCCSCKKSCTQQLKFTSVIFPLVQQLGLVNVVYYWQCQCFTSNKAHVSVVVFTVGYSQVCRFFLPKQFGWQDTSNIKIMKGCLLAHFFVVSLCQHGHVLTQGPPVFYGNIILVKHF